MLYLKLCFLRLCCLSVSWHGQLQIQKFQDVHWVSHSWGYYLWLCATNSFLSSCLLRSEVMIEFLLKKSLSSPWKPQGLFLTGSSVCSRMKSRAESGMGPVGFPDEAFTVGSFTIAGATFRRTIQKAALRNLSNCSYLAKNRGLSGAYPSSTEQLKMVL